MKPASAILRSLAAKDGEQVTMNDVLEETGRRAHGFGLLLFALPQAVPLPLGGISVALAIPLLLLSAHLIVFGVGSGIPERSRRYGIRATWVRQMVRYAAPLLTKLELLSRPRLQALADRSRLLGVVCLLLAIVIFLPIPFGNLVPGVCIILIAFGMVERDGLIISLGFVATLALFIGLYFAADWIADFMIKTFSGYF